MNLRRSEYARLEAAGWTVIVDSPWPRLAERLRTAARSVSRSVSRSVFRPAERSVERPA
jgi:hypothetical protein